MSGRTQTQNKSFSKSQKVATKSTASFSKEAGVSKRRHEPRRRLPAAGSAAADETPLLAK